MAASPRRFVYLVSWIYPTFEEFEYPVLATEAQARAIETFLERFTKTGYIAAASVEEVGDPLSVADLTNVFKEEFPRAEKEWFPK